MNKNLIKNEDISIIEKSINNELMDILYKIIMFKSDNEQLVNELSKSILGLRSKNFDENHESVRSISDKYLYFDYDIISDDEIDGFNEYNIVIINMDTEEFYFSTENAYNRIIRKYVVKGKQVIKTSYVDDFNLFQDNTDCGIDRSIKNLQYLVEIQKDE